MILVYDPGWLQGRFYAVVKVFSLDVMVWTIVDNCDSTVINIVSFLYFHFFYVYYVHL